MLQFLNPIWLFGISAVLIPLIIHLWNIKTGKTLKVGSIALMGESSRQNSRSLRLMDLLLLFLRCLLIIILSTLLAEPVWESRNLNENSKAWILAEKEHLTETYSAFKTEIDSLLKAGAEFHFLEPGFQKADLANALKDSTLAGKMVQPPYWSLLKLLDQKIPETTKAYVFTNDRLYRFSGPRPEFPAAINWKTYTPADSTSGWIENAYLSASGSIRTTLAQSSPAGIIRKTLNLDPGSAHPDIETSIRDGKPVVQFAGQQISADTASLKIAVYSEFQGDEGYLHAVLKAIQSYSSRKVRMVPADTEKDFLFWLSAKDIPAELLQTISPGGTAFRYANGKTTIISSWIESQSVQISAKPALIYKRISHTGDPDSFSVWEDGFGTPLLELTPGKAFSTYTLYTRLDPQWTDLVWSADFVKLLMPVLLPASLSTYQEKSDTRSLPAIGSPASPKLIAQSSDLTSHISHLNYYFWLLLLLIFLIERWLSFRTQPLR